VSADPQHGPAGPHIKNLLRDRQLAPNKRFGQNFLVHRHTAERIVELAGVTERDTVVEIGVGLGALTIPLAARAGKVIGLEIDAGLVRYHEEQRILPANVELLHLDVLKADLRDLAERCGGELKIIANLPYSISTPLLFRLIDNHHLMAWGVLMLQKEVGRRLVARPSTKDYGVLAIQLATCAATETLLELGPNHFHPRPKVDSLVQRLIFRPVPEFVRALPPFDRHIFKTVVRAAFQQRRKTLLNALAASALLGVDKTTLTTLLNRLDIPPASRAENLTVRQFIDLTNLISQGAPPERISTEITEDTERDNEI